MSEERKKNYYSKQTLKIYGIITKKIYRGRDQGTFFIDIKKPKIDNFELLYSDGTLLMKIIENKGEYNSSFYHDFSIGDSIYYDASRDYFELYRNDKLILKTRE